MYMYMTETQKKNDKKRDENQPKSANSGPQSRPTSPQVGPLQVRPEHRLEHIRGPTGLHNNSKPPSTEHNNDIWSFRTAIQANGWKMALLRHFLVGFHHFFCSHVILMHIQIHFCKKISPIALFLTLEHCFKSSSRYRGFPPPAV